MCGRFLRAFIIPSFSCMRRLRRPLALLVGLIFLHLMAVESGFACATPSSPSDAGHAAMTAMAEMPGMTHEPAPADAAPCDVPAAPPHSCDAMAACAPVAVAAGVILDAPPGPEPARLVTLDAVAPASRTPAPEPPPPRA